MLGCVGWFFLVFGIIVALFAPWFGLPSVVIGFLVLTLKKNQEKE